MEPTAAPADVATPAAPAPPLWVGLVTWIAVALVGLVALQFLGIIFQALSLGSTHLPFQDELGYAFLQNLDQAPLGLELLFAVSLVLLPVIVRQPTTRSQDRAAQVVIMGAAGLALLVMLGGVIGVPARTHILHLQKQHVTNPIRTVLITFLIRNVGTASLALVASVAAVRVRFQPRRVVAAPPTEA